ncbi:MAG: protein TolQ [Gammaproteobacteria bacterium]|nr:protein TolQ [Gammaproteobacteria bacterium]
MNSDQSLLSFFTNAGAVVQIVMFILLLASIFSWTFIFQKSTLLKSVNKRLRNFEKTFWSGIDIRQFYHNLLQQKNKVGIETVFIAGYKEFIRMQENGVATEENILHSVQRAMSSAQLRVEEDLNTNLSFLATVGSTGPYIGLFGTVWGIMTAFSALGTVQQATIAMVAPGISEALIATAMGLFAAIPSVISYNRFSTRADLILNRIDGFQEDLLRVLSHELYGAGA